MNAIEEALRIARKRGGRATTKGPGARERARGAARLASGKIKSSYRTGGPYVSSEGVAACTKDCSGHEAGWAWADSHGVDNPNASGGKSRSFDEGMQARARRKGFKSTPDEGGITLRPNYATGGGANNMDAYKKEILRTAREVVESYGGGDDGRKRAAEFFRKQAREYKHPQFREGREAMAQSIESGEYRKGEPNHWSARVVAEYPREYGELDAPEPGPGGVSLRSNYDKGGGVKAKGPSIPFERTQGPGSAYVPKRYPTVKASPDPGRADMLFAKGGATGDDDYHGSHRPAGPDWGAPMHDVSGEISGDAIYPPDIYSHKGLDYYGGGHPHGSLERARDMTAWQKILDVRGKPDAKVTVWRAIPWNGKPGKHPGILTSGHINPGDWVSSTRGYAIEHGLSQLAGERDQNSWALARAIVPASELWTEGSSLHEWGWHPKKERAYGGGVKSLRPIYAYRAADKPISKFDVNVHRTSDQDPDAGRAQMLFADGGATPKRTLIQASDGGPSHASLAKAISGAVEHHVSLPMVQRVLNTRDAAARVSKFVGKTSTGATTPLLSSNAKLDKAKAGSKTSEPLTLPDGRGVQTVGLTLAPAYKEGKFNTCPNSASCKDICLGKTSGHYYQYGGGRDFEKMLGPRGAYLRRTKALIGDPGAFGVRLHDEINAAKHIAAMNGDHLGVRLNTLSDLHPEVYKSIIKAHPDVSFYDYTKNNTNPVAPNHHLTYSSTGVSQPGVHNEHSNWRQMRRRLDSGSNVAMVFSHKKELPEHVHDQETGKRYAVVRGDQHDFTPLHTQPKGADGVIVGLTNKKSFGNQENAAKDSNGFFVHFDPKTQRHVEIMPQGGKK